MVCPNRSVTRNSHTKAETLGVSATRFYYRNAAN